MRKVLLENDFVPLMRAETYAVYATRKGLRVDYKNPTP